MKKLLMVSLIVAALVALSFNVFAAGTAEQLVSFTIGASNEISVSGSPGLLEILAPAAGEDPIPVSDNNTSISYSTNSSNKKITGDIDSDMPLGVSLQVHIASPGGAQGISQGSIPLSLAASDLVTGISKAAVQDATITYSLAATTSADPVENAARTVTFTMTAD
ncbi:hypothetical protein ACFL2X_03870 [Candidatus Latescibacterota bacterium]